jgi:DNA adenine methylase
MAPSIFFSFGLSVESAVLNIPVQNLAELAPKSSLPTDIDTLLRPALKWAGGKRWLVPRLRKLYAPYRNYRLVEPFVGGMGVALALSPARAYLSDINPHLINFYQWAQQGLTLDEIDAQNDRAIFDRNRIRFNELIAQGQANSRTAAALFYYLNRTAFNGLCRFNSKGFFNVPFGKYKTIGYISDFTSYQKVLSQWTITAGDFTSIEITDSDFLYVDPPYDAEFTKYAKEDFSFKDQERLVTWLSSLSCPIVASNQATERMIALYEAAGFDIEQIEAPRRIACNGDRKPAMEILACKNL